MSWNPTYEPVIGLEVHAQLKTASKAFCGCSTRFGDHPNGNVCPVCLGMPGVLPVLNRQVVEFTLLMGLATHCSIRTRSTFARKNYFYPDLPKGYQISQFDQPICTGGWIEFDMPDGSRRHIGITRIHMEEDAGKSIHDLDIDTLVDLNRCGVPLIEIVSEPDLREPAEASRYLQTIRQIVTYLGICDGNMEEGSLRCDANVSVRKKGTTAFGTKTEVKNMNSFRFVERAIEFEIHRQIELLESGGRVVQETMLWDSQQGVAVPMRSKEEAHDYRYFPEPDLVPVVVSNVWIEEARAKLPEMPGEMRQRFVKEYGLPPYDADVLTAEPFISQSFEVAIGALKQPSLQTFKLVSNRIMTDFLHEWKEGHINEQNRQFASVTVSGIVNMQHGGLVNSTTGSLLFTRAIKESQSPEELAQSEGLLQTNDLREIESVVDQVLLKSATEVEKYRAGKEQLFGFFVGQVMKMMQGKANPQLVNELLKKKLK